jgi:OmpA-OmpF porin, OOP family
MNPPRSPRSSSLRLGLLLVAGSVLLAGCQNIAVLSAPAAPLVKVRPPVREEVILLPSPDGRKTAIAVSVAGDQKLLDKPYAAASLATGQPIVTRTATPAEVDAIAGIALRSLPMKPVSFMLFFDLDSDRIRPESEKLLAGIVAEIAKRQVPDVSIIGHTDRAGRPEYNQKLSLRRAEQVHRLLAEREATGKIEVVGKGESENVVAQKKRAPEQRNRRVEVIVR